MITLPGTQRGERAKRDALRGPECYWLGLRQRGSNDQLKFANKPSLLLLVCKW